MTPIHRRSTLLRFSWWWLTLAVVGVNVIGLCLLMLAESASISIPLAILIEVLTAGVAAVALFMYARSLERRLLRPLQQVTDVTRAITEGAVSGRIELSSEACIDVQRVADAVNKMAEKASKDIGDMKRLERVRSEFVANVSHELRTPIFSVQGYLETLLDGAFDDPRVSKQFLEKAFTNALRLNTLLSDLIDISRIESGELRLSFRYFNVIDLIHDTVSATELRAQQRNVTVRITEPNQKQLMVYGDKERLGQVLTNLIDNAIKYNVQGGTVTVALSLKEATVTIAVADTGIGIPPEHVHRIFERFYRVDKDRSRAVGGTGLGLAIVKHILEAHHAPLHVTSTVGVGTTISFTLKADESV
ncbi:MAG: ATP-binding protein [Candidatus Kapabacteria bacterium]|nr:ATP-binding protein [Candidatus Kapabacteria bacterium]